MSSTLGIRQSVRLFEGNRIGKNSPRPHAKHRNICKFKFPAKIVGVYRLLWTKHLAYVDIYS